MNSSTTALPPLYPDAPPSTDWPASGSGATTRWPRSTTANTTANAAAARSNSRYLGKYREIIIAVVFFLVFDLAVLALNFYVSFQIGADAVAINLSGRQRMLSQRTAKALFSLETVVLKGEAPGRELSELKLAAELFDTSLRGFMEGGVVPGGNGKPVHLERIESAPTRAVLDQARALWEPWRDSIEPLLVIGSVVEPLKVSAAAALARQSNLELLRLMNELTTQLEADAAQRAATLRAVQTGGIVLALLNFLFILFKFIRRLRQSDVAVEQAGEENREILASVREGLFLLTPDGRLGSQISVSVGSLFGRSVMAGERFLDVLGPLINQKTLADTTSYIDLLFAPHVKEQLIQGINPLAEVETQAINRLGERQSRYLSFQFNRVQENGRVLRLLVTVQDVSARVAVEARLAHERRRAQHEFDFLLRAFEIERDTLMQFVNGAESRLLDVNDRLRGISSACGEAQVRQAVEAIYRHVHTIKGEAALFKLELLATNAHQFESLLQPLRERGGGASGEALLSLPLPLEELLGRIQALKQLAQRMPAKEHSADSPSTLASALDDLTQRMASETGKRLRSDIDLQAWPKLSAAARKSLLAIATQLARNAVVHGIETPPLRLATGKPSTGRLQIALEQDAQGTSLLVADDGCGLHVDKIKSRLQELAWYTQEQLDEMSDQQIVAQIFKPGFSSASEVTEHAGRGIGLDVVLAQIRELGARIQVSSRPGLGCTFRVCFGFD